jgi:hypothetical protein
MRLAGSLSAALLAAALFFPQPARSEAYDLVLWIARLATNEGAFKNRHEAALVWQTVRESAPTLDGRRRWLQEHSPRVHLLRPCLSGNCLWTPHLQPNGAFPDGLVLEIENPIGFWNAKLAPVWLDTLEYVRWLVEGERASDDPCHIPPRTWGCEGDRESAIRERDLYPIGCHRPFGDKSDDGFTRRVDCYRDGVWSCDPRFAPVIESKTERLER